MAVHLPFLALNENATLPALAHAGDGAFDLTSSEEIKIQPGERATVGCGFAVAIPAGYAAYILPRSGLAAKHGITVLNAPGLVDSPYRGEVKVCLLNTDKKLAFAIAIGDRIAQMMIVKLVELEFETVDELDETARGAGGFGSSGR